MNWYLVVTGLFVHLVFFYSIFDIYFTSPLVHGMTPHAISFPAPARRLVLFVADGLRADKFYELGENGLSRARYLRNIIENEGVWGVSHTRVPTESRPGHVALIAGFSEDVSAVAKGWKDNPVDFDSVFNESSNTWSWGSPDILPMFAKGATGNHVQTYTYPADSEDFAQANASNLDTWVFERVKEFFADAALNESLKRVLDEDRLVFFLHLLAIDTLGHSHKPYSKECLESINVVDRGVRETVDLVENFFEHDSRTAYVFTSDHGMTDWGSHGSGDPSETLTPIVAWGAGVRKALQTTPSDELYGNELTKAWNLTDVKRSDVNQVDICPLMASLIGVPFPMNSMGILPLDYLSTTEEIVTESLFSNALQILAQFQVKFRQKRDTTISWFFKPFMPLTEEKQEIITSRIRSLIAKRDFVIANNDLRALIELGLQGLNYYHNYNRFFLGICISMGYIGWIAYVTSVVLADHSSVGVIRDGGRLRFLSGPRRGPFGISEKMMRMAFILLAIVLLCFLYAQSQPFTHYLYYLLPVFLWHKVLQSYQSFSDLIHYVTDTGNTRRLLVGIAASVVGIEIMISSFFYRELLTVGMLGLAALPHIISSQSVKTLQLIGWTGSCCALALFPLLPVVGGAPRYLLVYAAGFVAFVMGIVIAIRKKMSIFVSSKSEDSTVKRLTVFQLALLLLALYNSWMTSSSISSGQGLPLGHQILSWSILVLSFIMPVLSGDRVLVRLFNIVFAFLPSYLLLSIAHEGFFYIVLCFVLFYWLTVENQFGNSKLQDLNFHVLTHAIGGLQRKLVLSDLRIAYCFILLLLMAFFGTGNMASINSFNLSSIYCFVTVFNPFVMGALMLWKILIPFLLVTCTFNAIHVAIDVPMQSLYLLVLIISDIMALHFFFLVRDEGSWLEIGISISHYVIVMSMICFLYLLLALSKIFTHWSLVKLWRAKMLTSTTKDRDKEW